MLRFLFLLAVTSIAAAGPAAAQAEWRPAPGTLTIGYEGEGKVDASPQACEAMVRGIVEWSEDEIRRGAREVCAARKRHAEAYAALQASYQGLVKHVGEDHRLDPGRSMADLAAMLKACMDHKLGLTTGGHNIALDIIPNDVATACLKIGKSLLDTEIDWFEVGFTDSRPTP